MNNSVMSADTEQLKTIANSIAAKSDEYDREIVSLINKIDSLTTVWDSKDGAKYIETIKSREEDLKSLGLVIKDYSKFIDSTATTINNCRDEIKTAANSKFGREGGKQ